MFSFLAHFGHDVIILPDHRTLKISLLSYGRNRNLMSTHQRAYRDGICQELREEHYDQRVNMALQGAKQIMEWETQFGRDDRFRYLFHSDEKIFEFNPSDHMSVRYF